jgi:broad specificity phosphatase PhoE
MLDPPLNDKGVLGAHKAAEFLSRQNIERIICSPLLRAVQTARVVAGVLGGRYICQTRELFPWEMGTEFYGKDRDELADRLEHFVKNPKEVPPNGECLACFTERTGDFFEDELKTPVVTLFVCHTSNIIALTDLIKGVPPTHPEQAEVVKPGGICAVYEVEEGDYEIEPIFKAEEKPAEFGS